MIKAFIQLLILIYGVEPLRFLVVLYIAMSGHGGQLTVSFIL